MNLPRTGITRPTTGFFQPEMFRSMSQTVPGVKFEITQESLRALEDYMAWAERIPRKQRQADDMLARFLSMMILGHAQKESFGPRHDPVRYAHPLSWMIPVPRITGRYYLGWKMRRIGWGRFIVTNTSREAFYIEFGLHRNPWTGERSPRRVRRPVMKRALAFAARASAQSAIAHRVFVETFYPSPGEPGHRTKNIIWHIQGGSPISAFTDIDAIPFGGGVGLTPFH